MNSVILVHPDEKFREAVGSILEQSGHAVTPAADGAGALDAFQRVRPDIVILNRELPDLPGFQDLRGNQADRSPGQGAGLRPAGGR